MKTYVVKIQHQSIKPGPAFDTVLQQLHETLQYERISFELLATGQNIAFCFATPNDAVGQIVASHIYGVCPDADIIEIPDYTKATETLSQNTRTLGVEIGLKRDDLFPIKDYREFEGDPLSSILSVLAKCNLDERVFIQIVCRPRRDSATHNISIAFRKLIGWFIDILRIKYWFKPGIRGTFSLKKKEKLSARLFDVNIRAVCLTSNAKREPRSTLEALFGSICNFNTIDYNQFYSVRLYKRLADLKYFQTRALRAPFLLSTRELATIFHLPNEAEVPNIVHVISQRKAPPTELPTDQLDPNISFFGHTNFRDQRVPFGIKREDRRRHTYILGKQGSGKSKVIELLVKSDIMNGHGVGVIDPHGDLIDNILKIIPEHRIKDVVLFDPADVDFPPSFNPLECVPEAMKIRVTIGFIEIFKKFFGAEWNHRLEHVLRYTTLALLDNPNTTVLSIIRILTDKNYRILMASNIKDSVVRNFWANEFTAWSENFYDAAAAPLINKIGQLLSTNVIKNILAQPENKFNFREIMDNKKILLMKISKGLLGDENAQILGGITLTKIYQAAMSRSNIPENQRVDFCLYIDEFNNFATDTFDEFMSESRKYGLNLTVTNQYLSQLNSNMRNSIFGNVGSMICFRVSGEDAETLAREFEPRFTPRDLVNLAVRDFVIKMSIDGEVKDAFSGRTLKFDLTQENRSEECRHWSRANYAKPATEVEGIIRAWEENRTDYTNTVDSDNNHYSTIITAPRPIIQQ